MQTRRRIAAHLRKAMKKREMTQAELARKLGVTQGAISRLLQSEGACGLDMVLRINRRMLVDAQHLLNDDPEPEYFSP